MRRKSFVFPKILMNEAGGDGSVIGGGTGHGGLVVITQPISLEAWLNDPEYATNLVGEDDTIDINDYVVWWGGMMVLAPDVFTQQAWIDVGNEPDLWEDYFGE